jgi:predicted ArsR family transcriptional regulator
MTESSQTSDRDVLRFIFDRIESVPHLEALLLIWNSRPKRWSANDLAKRLYVDRRAALDLLRDLTRQNLVAADPGSPEDYFYETGTEENDKIIAAVYAKYSVEIVAVSTMIHRKSSSAVRDFADAFRFTKERH